jgi:hypothetical protein
MTSAERAGSRDVFDGLAGSRDAFDGLAGLAGSRFLSD